MKKYLESWQNLEVLLYGNEGNLIQVWKPESMKKSHNWKIENKRTSLQSAINKVSLNNE